MAGSEESQSLEYHISELRNRLFHSVVVFIVLTASSFYLSGDIMSFLQSDLNLQLNTFRAYEAFYTQLMIAFIFGFFSSLPVLLYQMLKFAKPGLRPHEYRIVRNFLPFSFILFVIGFVFSYEFVVKTSLSFFKDFTANAGVRSVWGLRTTVGFALKLSAANGVMFQLPVISVVLGKAGLITGDKMREYRAYVLVGILVIAAVATPPDLITQIMITLPVIGLYQISIFLVDRIEPV